MSEKFRALQRPVIALLTDFGDADPFVGIMKAVILARCPTAAIVDLTHALPSQAVGEAAFWLDRCVPWLAPGSVCLAVVDPGVGTMRRPLVIEARSMLFIGPDNGLLSPALSDDERRIFRIDATRLGLPKPSKTFHGRDVFAPVAADLAAGRIAPRDVGPELTDPVPAASRGPAVFEDRVEGRVVTVDRFGNLITNIGEEFIDATRESRIEVGSLTLAVRGTYADVASGEYVALVNAFGTIEVAKRDGDAAASLGLGRGVRVLLRGAGALRH